MSPRSALRLLALLAPVPSSAKFLLIGAAYRLARGLGNESKETLSAGSMLHQAWVRGRTAPDPTAAPRGEAPGSLVVVVDQYVPRPDRDAGSRSMWEVLRTLRAQGHGVLLWPNVPWYEPGYAERLQALGVEVACEPWRAASLGELLEERRDRIRAVLLSRPLIAREYLPVVRRHSRAPVLFYGHDLQYERLAQQAQVAGRKPGFEQRWMRRLETSLWRRVEVVLYPSDSEVRIVQEHCPGADARVLPLYAFDTFGAPRPARDEVAGNLFMVANFGHEPNADGLRWLVQDVLPKLRLLRQRFRIRVAGGGAPASLRALEAPEIDWLGPVSDEALDTLYRESDLALVPLRFGAGVKGKVVEALRWGLPLVTTPVGVQGLPQLEEIVAIHEDAAGFARAIDGLLRDPADRAWRSGRMIDYARGSFTREAMARALAFSPRP